MPIILVPSIHNTYERPDVLLQLGYTWRHVSALKRPSSCQLSIIILRCSQNCCPVILSWREDGRLTSETRRQLWPSCNKASGLSFVVYWQYWYNIYLIIHNGKNPFKNNNTMCAAYCVVCYNLKRFNLQTFRTPCFTEPVSLNLWDENYCLVTNRKNISLWNFCRKEPQHAFLRRGSKAVGPIS